MMWQNIIAVSSLAIGVFTLRYLIVYVKATRVIADQSVLQTEAQSRPAVVVQFGAPPNPSPVLVNIGNGPAIDLKWFVHGGSKKGSVQYLEPRQTAALDNNVASELRSIAVDARMKGQVPDEQ